MQMHAHPHVLCVCVCVQYLTPHSMMRGYLARDILSFEVADVLKEKAEHSGERSSFFASLALFWLCLLRVTGSLLALSSSRHWLSSGFVTGSQRLSCGDSAMAIALVGFTYDFTLDLATYDSRTRIEPRAVFDARTWCTSAHSLACVVGLANGTP